MFVGRGAEILQNTVNKVEEVKNLIFSVFSYHHDFAANFGLIDAEKGVSLAVVDFETPIKCVC